MLLESRGHPYITTITGQPLRMSTICLALLRTFPLFIPSLPIATPGREKMTTSRRLADRKIQKFQMNVTKRGSVPETTVKKGYDYTVGPVMLGFFVFVVIGSSLFQIIRTATSGGMA